MTAQEAYLKFIIKINKNAQTNNISCDRGRFTRIFNESQNQEVEYILEKKDSDDIRYVQKLLVPNAKLQKKEGFKFYDLFELEDNYFDHATLLGYASTDCCTEQVMDMYEIKSDNENLVVLDELNKPHFGFREAPYYLAEDSIKAFKDSFEYDYLEHTYYRYPQQIELQDPQSPESQFSQDPELDDKITDRIISRAAANFELNNNSPKYQAEIQRAKSK